MTQRARVQNFQYAGWVMTFESLTSDLVEPVKGILAWPELKGWRVSSIHSFGDLPSWYVEPPDGSGVKAKDRNAIKARVKAELRSRGFNVVAENTPIGTQVR